MKKLFYFGLFLLLAFEICNIYFIMPMPGSQRMDSVAYAYVLYHWRWVFRSLFLLMMVVGFVRAPWKRRWLPLIPLVLIGVVIWFANFRMSADHMFRQPSQLVFADAAHNKIDSNRLVLGVFFNNHAKAYPIQFLGYHHIVEDSVGDTPVLVTYCTVCRTGRVYDPRINGQRETFRLVGMDHFNAMMEDVTTKSWWRQVTGDAVAGELKGQHMSELFCTQTTLAEWLQDHPSSLIMQRDPALHGGDPKRSLDYETGNSTDGLTGTNPQSWQDKSWVLGITVDGKSTAYDWNLLKEKRLITDRVGNTNLFIVLASDKASFYAMETPAGLTQLSLSGDTVLYNGRHYRLDGEGIDTNYTLRKVPVHQEFWHSWRTFHPGTAQYK